MPKLFKCLILLLILSSGFAKNEAIERGQEYFFQYCSACHSLSYAPTTWSNKLNQPWQNALTYGKWQTRLQAEDARKWFGRMPPDLSLVGLQRSKLWIKDYLNGFYNDSQHPLGRNNRLINQVLMPDVLWVNETRREEIAEDIACFLISIARPELDTRYFLGKVVLAVCILALLVTWFLRKAYHR